MDRLELAQYVMGPEYLLKAERVKYSERTFQHYKAMQQSAEQFERAYRKQLDKMLSVIRDYAESKIVHDSLKKAEGPYDPIANPEHLREIRRIVNDYHLAFIATQVGGEYVDAADIQRLIDSGVLPQDMKASYQAEPGETAPPSAQAIADAYNYGISMGRDPQLRGQAATLGVDPWRTKYGDPTLSTQEQAARTWASGNAANTIVGLGNRVGDDFSTIAVEADAVLRAKYQADVRDELDMNIERQESWRKLASDLGHRTQDWARDFKRISATEKQSAMQQGLTAGLIEREGDPDEINVAKQPSPGACPRCVALHYTSGEGSPLRIFKLSELQANGTNVGKKQSAWQATIGPIHPWCSCELIHVPNGWGFNEDGDLMPQSLLRSQLLPGDLRKAHLTWGNVVPERGCAIRIGDPQKLSVAQAVIDRTPPEIFDRRVGVTLICEDQPRVDNAMEDHDLAYWTGNEIRVSGTLPLARLKHVLEHELGHSLNVWLMYCWGGEAPVIKWHKKLFGVSKREGFVSPYAQTAPIENAAELTRLYLYERKLIMMQFPLAFSMLHRAYKGIWRKNRNDRPLEDRPGEQAKQEQDRLDYRKRGGARL